MKKVLMSLEYMAPWNDFRLALQVAMQTCPQKLAKKSQLTDLWLQLLYISTMYDLVIPVTSSASACSDLMTVLVPWVQDTKISRLYHQQL